MKKFTLFFTAILFAITGTLAQTPNQFKYQAVLRNADGTIMSDQSVTVDILILQGSATGTSVFNESHSVATTAQGLINLNIGSVSNLSVVDWSADTYFLEISINGTTMGTSQLLSVPYAMNAKTAENVFSGNYSDLTNQPSLFDGTFSSLSGTPTTVSGYGITDAFSGNYNDLTNQPSLFDGAFSSLSGTPTTVSGYGITDAFSGKYNDLTNQPILFNGAYSSLTGTPTTIAGYGITDAFRGNYNDLTNLPTLFSGSYTDLTNAPDFTGWDTDASNDFDGNYNSLTNLPTLFSGNYLDLSNQPNLTDSISTYGFSGSFNDLVNIPVNLDIDSTDDFSGSYTDLTNKPTIPNQVWSEAGSNVYFNEGKVGIGTSSPTGKLSIVDGSIGIHRTGSFSSDERSGITSSNDINDYIQMEARGSEESGLFLGQPLANTAYIRATDLSGSLERLIIATDGETSGADIHFVTGNNISGYATRLFIKEDGNIGLGTENPTSKFQVVGLPEYADNVAALAGGLTVGAFYRTGDILKVVH